MEELGIDAQHLDADLLDPGFGQPGLGVGDLLEQSLAVAALLVFAGVLTALPLIGFSYAVRRVPYSVIGFMQYIAPTLQLLIGVLVFHEVFDRDRAIGFIFIWIGLAIFAIDGFWRSRNQPARGPVADRLD